MVNQKVLVSRIKRQEGDPSESSVSDSTVTCTSFTPPTTTTTPGGHPTTPGGHPTTPGGYPTAPGGPPTSSASPAPSAESRYREHLQRLLHLVDLQLHLHLLHLVRSPGTGSTSNDSSTWTKFRTEKFTHGSKLQNCKAVTEKTVVPR